MPIITTSDVRYQDAWHGATSFAQMSGKSARKSPYEAPYQTWHNTAHIFTFGNSNIIDVDDEQYSTQLHGTRGALTGIGSAPKYLMSIDNSQAVGDNSGTKCGRDHRSPQKITALDGSQESNT